MHPQGEGQPGDDSLSDNWPVAVAWHGKKKKNSLCVPHCEMYIKLIAWTKVLFFGETKEGISIFVP